MIDQKEIMILQKMIRESNQIVFVGGAGVSTESGIPDFRSANGIYHMNDMISPEEIISHSFFIRNPEVFYEFYKSKMVYLNAKPNKAHQKLAELEKAGKLKAIVTQNIDGLHQMAGSQNVIELHGSIHRNYCLRCHAFYNANDVVKSTGIPYCKKCGGMIKPDVVLYEESLDCEAIDRAISAIRSADMLIVGGTSLTVYPAAGFVDYFGGKYLVLINKSETSKQLPTDLTITAPIGEVFSQIEVE